MCITKKELEKKIEEMRSLKGKRIKIGCFDVYQ